MRFGQAGLGLETIITEKSDVWGGSAAMSAGALWIPANDKMSAVGIDDSEADALGQLLRRRYLRNNQDEPAPDVRPSGQPNR